MKGLTRHEVLEERELESEFRRLERAHDKLTKKIAAFKKSVPALRPYRYVLNFEFDVGGLLAEPADVSIFPSETRSFSVRENTVFFVEEITFSFQARGTLATNGQNATLLAGPNGWKAALDFDWRVRDTGSNREWQNRALPVGLLMSNSVNPLRFGNGHSRLEGGAEVFFQIIPTRVIPLIGGSRPFSAVNSYNVEITFGGQERILGAAG